MERVNLNHLYYFYVVSIEGSIKKASEFLHVTQPTISDQIKLLEDYFELPLFIRENRRLSLSEQGKVIQEYAEKIFHLSDELNKRIKHGLVLPKISIDIGMTSFMYEYFKPEDLGRLFSLKDYKINFHEDKRPALLLKLEEGVIDVLFTDSKEGINSSYKVFSWGKNKTFAIADKTFKKRGVPFPEVLNGLPFFHYSKNQTLRHDIDLFFSKNDMAVQVIGEGDDISLINHVLEKKIAFCVVPEFIKDFLREKNKNITVLGELKSLESNVYAVTKPNYSGPLLELLK